MAFGGRLQNSKNPGIGLLILVSGMLLFGCVGPNPSQPGQSNNTPANNISTNIFEENETVNYSPNEIFFYAPDQLPDAMVGFSYNYSFCDPVPTNKNDLCGGLEDADNPSGGQHPYHFTLASGTGFQPMGMLLNLNGLLSGTPTAPGNNTFGVCAVDLAGNQQCSTVILTVKKPIQLTVHVKGTGSGSVTVYGSHDSITCREDCNMTFLDSYSTADVPFMPDNGSAFSGWSGDCEYAPCSLYMREDKEVTATFDKFAITASATCSHDSSSGYNSRVEIRGTATGPKGTIVQMVDLAGYNGFLNNVDDCGSWEPTSIGCKNNGTFGTTQWYSAFNMGSPTYAHPFVWTPTWGVLKTYGGSFYNTSIQEPLSTSIVVPVQVSCP